MAVTNAPFTDPAIKEVCERFEKAVNICYDMIVYSLIKRTTDIRLHLRKVLLPVSPNHIQVAKASYMLIGMGRCVKVCHKASNLSKERKISLARLFPGFQHSRVGKAHHYHSIIHDCSICEC